MNTIKTTKAVVLQVENREEWDTAKANVKIFRNAEWQDMFILSALLAVRKGVKKPWKTKRNFLFRREAIRPKNLDIIQSIAAFDSGKIEIIENIPGMFQIIEDYANAGIKLLIAASADRDVDYAKLLESEIRDVIATSPYSSDSY